MWRDLYILHSEIGEYTEENAISPEDYQTFLNGGPNYNTVIIDFTKFIVPAEWCYYEFFE